MRKAPLSPQYVNGRAADEMAPRAVARQAGWPPIAVAIVTYNTREHLRACLATVLGDAPYEVMVVDNGSSDGSVELVKAHFPDVALHPNRQNRGYGAGANQAIADCKAKYVLLLNSDTLLAPGALEALADYLDRNPRAAIVGPRLLYRDGQLQRSCFPFPTPLNSFLRESALSSLIRHVPMLREHYLLTWSHTHPRVVPWVLGAALAIRREAFEAVGGFDESFFMYYEEIDLCYRLHAAGWQVHFAPVTNIVHIGEASTIRNRSAMAVQLYGSMNHFYRRHYSVGQMRKLRLIKTYIMLRNIARDVVRLLRASQSGECARLAQDLAVWTRVLHEDWSR
jgi:N-acetylglucosaminyl-diphospho-decaprenol L-rhamnosyltransferase